MKFLKVLVASALLSAFTAVRLPVSAAPPSSAQVATVSYLAWLPPARQTQAATFENLTYDAQYQVQLPSYPETGLLGWSLRRYHIVPASNPKALYALVYEDLLIAQKLLTGTNLARQREGMHLALNAERCAHVTLKDNPLSANIYEGFLLPYYKYRLPGKMAGFEPSTDRGGSRKRLCRKRRDTKTDCTASALSEHNRPSGRQSKRRRLVAGTTGADLSRTRPLWESHCPAASHSDAKHGVQAINSFLSGTMGQAKTAEAEAEKG